MKNRKNKFGLRSRRWRNATVDPTSQRKRKLLRTIDQLASENEELRDLIEDVFEILNEIEETDEHDRMFEAIDTACHYIISDLPNDYQYDDEDTSLDASANLAEDQAQKGNAAAAMKEVAKRRLLATMAKDLGTDPDAVAEIRDPNVTLAALRRSLLKELTGEELQDDPIMTEEDYEASIAENFLLLFLLSATPPFSYKKEALRYAEAFGRIKKRIPKRTRTAGADVQKALDMRNKGHTWSEISDKIIDPLLKGPERRQESINLKTRVRSLRSIRKRRARDREQGG